MYKFIIIAVVNLMLLQVMASERPTAFELLDKYAATQDKLGCFIVKGKSSSDILGSYSSPQHKLQSGRKRKFVLYELRFDSKRFYWCRQMWGNLRFVHEFIPKDKPHYKRALWDGKFYHEYAKAPYIRPGPGTVEINKIADAAKVKKTIPYIPYICAQMFGFFDKERIDSVLRQAETMSVQDQLEYVGGSKCYVVKAVTRSGKYSVWIDPMHGYNIAKAEIRRAENDLVDGERLARGWTILSSIKNVRFEEIGNVWVPMEADIQQANNQPNGDFSRFKVHYKRTEFIVNPDHDELSSFFPDDIKDGAKVLRINGVRVKEHTWQQGRVVDKTGRVVMDFMAKKSAKQ